MCFNLVIKILFVNIMNFFKYVYLMDNIFNSIFQRTKVEEVLNSFYWASKCVVLHLSLNFLFDLKCFFVVSLLFNIRSSALGIDFFFR